MPVFCNGCNNQISTQNYMECSICNQLYDLECLNIALDAFEGFTQDFKYSWICPSCSSSRPKGDNTHTPLRNPVGCLSNNKTSDNVNMTRGSRRQDTGPTKASNHHELSDLTSEIRQLRLDVKGLKKQNSELLLLRNDVQELKEQLSSMTTLRHKVTEYEKKIHMQEHQIVDLRECLTSLQFTVNTHEQNALKNELEIAGLPESDSENLHHVVMVTAKKLGVDLLDTDIDEISRSGPKHPRAIEAAGGTERRPRPIVVKLQRRKKRDEI